MIPTLLIGRKGSVGFPGKNTTEILGRPLSLYPILAAKNVRSANGGIYLSTDDPKLIELAKREEVEVIERPAYLCTSEALGEDAFVHGYEEIKKRNPGKEIEMINLLFCNAATFLSDHIEKGISLLRENPEYDSAVTVSQYNWYAPVRARRIGEDKLLHPFIPFENYPEGILINCDRNAQGDVYFADVCVSVVRPRCLENIKQGILPQRWMGKKIAPIENWGGLDVDKEWQMPLVEFWLKKNGFTEKTTPYDKSF